MVAFTPLTLEAVREAVTPTEGVPIKVFTSIEPIVVSEDNDMGLLSPITEPVSQFTADLVGTATGAISDTTGTVTQATTSATGSLVKTTSVLPGIGGIGTTTLLLIGLVAFLLLRK